MTATRAYASGPTRRGVLVGAAGAALAAATPVRPLAADAAHRLRVGAIEVAIVSDGVFPQPLSFLLPDRSAADVSMLLAARGLPTDGVQAPTNVVVVRTAQDLVLIDTGAGAGFLEPLGRLAANLEAAGLDRTAVTRVVFTHGHPDHLWGAIDELDEIAFPNARFSIAALELDHWFAPATLARLPDAFKPFALGARRVLRQLAERVDLAAPDAVVAPGLTLVSTPGHTPGHSSVLIESGAERMVVVGDALGHAVFAFERPDWHWGSDWDAEQGAATRRRLLDWLATDRLPLAGYHLPWPGLGRVERAGTAFRFVAGA